MQIKPILLILSIVAAAAFVTSVTGLIQVSDGAAPFSIRVEFQFVR